MSVDSDPSGHEQIDFQRLDYFPYLFNDEEVEELKRWGDRAHGLTYGSIEAKTEKEQTFVSIAKGYQSPKTRKHKLWLRYVHAIAVLSMYRSAVNSLHEAQQGRKNKERCQTSDESARQLASSEELYDVFQRSREHQKLSELPKTIRRIAVEGESRCEACGRPISFCSCGG